MGYGYKANPHLTFENEFGLSPFGSQRRRQAYSLLDVLGDIAGMFELISAVLGLVLYKVSEHSFQLKALNRLFLVSTEDAALFRSEKAPSSAALVASARSEVDER